MSIISGGLQFNNPQNNAIKRLKEATKINISSSVITQAVQFKNPDSNEIIEFFLELFSYIGDQINYFIGLDSITASAKKTEINAIQFDILYNLPKHEDIPNAKPKILHTNPVKKYQIILTDDGTLHFYAGFMPEDNIFVPDGLKSTILNPGKPLTNKENYKLFTQYISRIENTEYWNSNFFSRIKQTRLWSDKIKPFYNLLDLKNVEEFAKDEANKELFAAFLNCKVEDLDINALLNDNFDKCIKFFLAANPEEKNRLKNDLLYFELVRQKFPELIGKMNNGEKKEPAIDKNLDYESKNLKSILDILGTLKTTYYLNSDIRKSHEAGKSKYFARVEDKEQLVFEQVSRLSTKAEKKLSANRLGSGAEGEVFTQDEDITHNKQPRTIKKKFYKIQTCHVLTQEKWSNNSAPENGVYKVQITNQGNNCHTPQYEYWQIYNKQKTRLQVNPDQQLKVDALSNNQGLSHEDCVAYFENFTNPGLTPQEFRKMKQTSKKINEFQVKYPHFAHMIAPTNPLNLHKGIANFVKGKTLCSMEISEINDIPGDVIIRFLESIDTIIKNGIIPDDMNHANFIYDSEAQRLAAIDTDGWELREQLENELRDINGNAAQNENQTMEKVIAGRIAFFLNNLYGTTIYSQIKEEYLVDKGAINSMAIANLLEQGKQLTSIFKPAGLKTINFKRTIN